MSGQVTLRYVVLCQAFSAQVRLARIGWGALSQAFYALFGLVSLCSDAFGQVLFRYVLVGLVLSSHAFCVAISSVETGSDMLSSVKSGQAFYVWICLVGSVLVWSILVMSGILRYARLYPA